MKEEELLKQYVNKFGKLPPEDVIISYYDDLYQDLIEKALEANKEITPEALDKAIGDKPYDVDKDNFDPDQEDDYE